jgi:hypothetical protein
MAKLMGNRIQAHLRDVKRRDSIGVIKEGIAVTDTSVTLPDIFIGAGNNTGTSYDHGNDIEHDIADDKGYTVAIAFDRTRKMHRRNSIEFMSMLRAHENENEHEKSHPPAKASGTSGTGTNTRGKNSITFDKWGQKQYTAEGMQITPHMQVAIGDFFNRHPDLLLIELFRSFCCLPLLDDILSYYTLNAHHRSLDSHKAGIVNCKEFVNGFEKQGIGIDRRELEILAANADSDADGIIDYKVRSLLHV